MVIRYQIVNTFLVWVCTRSGLVEKSLLIADIILIGQHFGLWWYPLNSLFYHLLLPVVQAGAPRRNQRRSNRADDQADKSSGKTTSIKIGKEVSVHPHRYWYLLPQKESEYLALMSMWNPFTRMPLHGPLALESIRNYTYFFELTAWRCVNIKKK